MKTCRRCGRELTDPKSIKKGIGPICEKKEIIESMQTSIFDDEKRENHGDLGINNKR